MGSTRRRILIADDYDDAAETVAAFLCMSGYEALAVHDGRQAVEAARAFRPDCVVLDLNMPGMNGFEVALALRAAQPGGTRLMLVCLSCDANSDAVEQGRRAGFDHHLAKPAHHLPQMINQFFEQADALHDRPCAP